MFPTPVSYSEYEKFFQQERYSKMLIKCPLLLPINVWTDSISTCTELLRFSVSPLNVLNPGLNHSQPYVTTLSMQHKAANNIGMFTNSNFRPDSVLRIASLNRLLHHFRLEQLHFPTHGKLQHPFVFTQTWLF